MPGDKTTQALTWDEANRLEQVRVTGSYTETYWYDESGIRARKQHEIVTTPTATLTPLHPLSETLYPFGMYEVENGTTTRYYLLNGQAIALRTASEDVTYLHRDQVGSVVMSTQNGAIVDSRLYHAYGSKRGGDDYPFEPNYTGQRRDETGLLYYNARYYDPELGMFISPDSIIPDPDDFFSYNRYLYAGGNPLKHNDPTGHCIDGLTTIACIVGGIAALLKVIDYGWTAYDSWQATSILMDPDASQAEKDAARINLAMTVGFEAAEPDDLLPIGLPLDDLARHGIIRVGREAGQEAVEQSFKAFTASSFRSNLQTLTGRTTDEIAGLQAHHILPQTFRQEFARSGLNVHDPKFGTWVDATHQQWSYAYQQEWREFLTQKPTYDAILEFAQGLAQEYRFETHFSIP